MTAWTAWTIAIGLGGARAAAAAVPPASGNRFEVRTLIGVLAIIIGLLVILIVLVAMSSVRRRMRSMTTEREARRRSRSRTGGRRIDAWAEAGKRAVLAEPPPLPPDAGAGEGDDGPAFDPDPDRDPDRNRDPEERA